MPPTERDDLTLAEVVAELERRRAQLEPVHLQSAFPEQRAFIEDAAKRKAALCSRRAGKSQGGARWLIDACLRSPGSLSLYIVQKGRAMAREIMGSSLMQVSHQYDLDLRLQELDGQLYCHHPNGSRIWLAGCKDKTEIEKFRGYAYRRIQIDEAQTFPDYLRELIEDALDPALLDFDGELALTGTPGVVPAGYFYAATTGEGMARWPTHTWTVLDNPHIPHAAAWLERKREQNRWDDSHPTYQREWLARWVVDSGAIVYPYDAGRNAFHELPQGRWRYAMGVDLGYEDSCAFVVGAYRERHPEIYLTHVEKRSGLIPSAVAAHVIRLKKEHNVGRVVVDTGGLGKGYAEELRQRYGVPVEAAEKQQKRAFIELVRGELLSGVVKVDPVACSRLLDEWSVLQWNEDKSEPDERFEDHAADAALYLIRAIRASYRPEEEPPREGSPEWYAAERDKHRKAAEQRVLKRQREWVRRYSR